MNRLNVLTSLVLLILLGCALFVTQHLLIYRPIRRLKLTVERLREGDFEARAPAAAGDELACLGEDLNRMADSLRRAKEELDRTHRAQLAQSEKLAALGQLTSGIAHEIKNPLAGIIAALKVLEDEAPAERDDVPILRKVRAQAERLSRTAVELLEFARPLKPDVRDVEVAELVDRSLFFIERQAQEQKIQIQRCVPPNLPPIRVDPDLVKQIFLNVLLNGVQAMPGGGLLRIEAAASGPAVDVSIADQGAGIPQESLERLFTPFFTTKPRGTGLGLYLARQMLDTQHGSISVQSRPGEGTVFTIRLPAAHPEAQDIKLSEVRRA